ncbi:NACHT and ankyrin domain protein [Podospora aff. communis PSN243]|uniref:NACHT and ankyrin domain protein n=1 Tax=Podospora aff. communis PSN243 TaxID=3040156 RepID=A0AAV9GMC9_9PEZI|nr:NACHT and ankyrin domain protein [Podospora aff. communis PSN243]
MSSSGHKRHASSAAPLAETQHLDKKQRVPSTCEWIRREVSYQSWSSWSDAVPSTLWILGPAGSGKSHVAHFILDELENTSDNSIVIGCYCDSSSTPKSLLQTALSCLLSKGTPSEDLKGRLSAVLEFANESSSASSPPSDTSYKLWDRFVDIIQASSPITLVVDGLDELPDQYLGRQEFDLARRLVELTSFPTERVRLLVLSRPHPDIRKALSGAPEIMVTQQKTHDDLERFVNLKISQLPGLASLPELAKAQLANELVRRSEGIFTWASLSLEALELKGNADGGLDPTSIVQHVAGLPSALDDTYAELLAKQAKTLTTTELTLRDAILRWTCAALRPLSVQEVGSAIALETLQFFPEQDGRMFDVCNSLIKIEDGFVLPMHHSLREFLHSKRSTGNKRSHAITMAKTLLSYLSHPAISDAKNFATDNNFASVHPLIEYASLYWVYHCTAGQPDADLQEQILAFFRSGKAVVWFDVLLPKMISRSVLSVPPRPPINARFFHLMSLKSQISSCFGPDKKKEVDTEISECFRSAYEQFLEEATATGDGSHSAQRLKRLLELGELYSWLPGHQDQVTGILEDALQLSNELSEPDTDDLKLTAYQALADEYKRQAKFEKARPLLEELITASTGDRKMFALDSLGWMNSRLGNLEAARSYLEQALEIARDRHGSQSPFTLRSKVTLAEVLGKLGRNEEAEQLCAALEAQVETHRVDGVPLPKDSISQLNTLAAVYSQRGKYTEAKELYELLVRDRKKTFGATHRLTLWAEMQLGVMMHKSGDAEKEKARQFLRELQPRQAEVLGPDHPDVRQVAELVGQE